MNQKNIIGICFLVIGILIISQIILVLRYNRDIPKGAALITASIGTRIVKPTIAFTVSAVRVDENGAGPLTPAKDSRFVIVEVSIENLASTTLDIAPILNFHIKDDKGWVYNSVAVPSVHEMLSGGILPNDTLREEIGFEVEKKASGLRLYYEPGRPNEGVIVIDLHK